jgi:hypothetical protein
MEEMLDTLNPTEADRLRVGRYQSVNVWKPLRGPIRDWPLALCDPRSVDTSELQARDTVRRDSYIETYQMHWNQNQKWYYVRDQMPNEAWVFLQGEVSETGGSMLGVPHTSFPNSLASADDLPRESIEVRAFVYYED